MNGTIVAVWSAESEGRYKGVDPQKAGNEIISLGENVVPEQIVEKARDESTELHKCFEWDDTKAAERYRITQARDVARHLKIVWTKTESGEPEVKQFRMFSHVKRTPGYTQTIEIVKKEDKYQILLDQAMEELRAFKKRYECLKELKEIFDLIPD